jgi:hypothetical protein
MQVLTALYIAARIDERATEIISLRGAVHKSRHMKGAADPRLDQGFVPSGFLLLGGSVLALRLGLSIAAP